MSILKGVKINGGFPFEFGAEVDDTLTVEGAPADAKKTGDEIEDLRSAISQGTGLTNEAKLALLNCFAHVAWIDEDGQDYYDALETALYPPAELSSISAVFTQGQTVIYDTASLNDLKQYLVVTAHYDDQSTETISNYTLSGTLSSGTSIITVSYGGKTTTFNVIVTHVDNSIYNWDFTQSLIDSKQNAEATIGSGCSRSSAGITFHGTTNAIVYLANLSSYSRGQYTVELDVTEFLGSILLSLATSNTMDAKCGIRWGSNKWRFYDCSNDWKDSSVPATDKTVFNGKTLKFNCDYQNGTWTVYADNVMVFTASVYAKSNSRDYLGLGTIDSNVGGGLAGNGTIITGCRIYEGIV